MRIALLPVLWTVACTSADKADSDTGGTTDAGDRGGSGGTTASGGNGGTSGTGGAGGSTAACTATIAATDPADGATVVPVDASITASFSAPIGPTDAFELTVDGVTGTSALAGDGLSASFTPAAPLDPETAYTAHASVCGSAPVAFSFTTLPPALDPVDLVGNTYGVPYADLEWITPTNADILQPNIEILLAQITGVDLVAETVSSVVGAGYLDLDGDVTIECDAAVDSGTADFSANPALSMGPADFVIPFGGIDIIIERFTLFTVVSADGATLDNTFISGRLDTRPLGFGDCALLALIAGGTCVPCADGEDQCLDAKASAGTMTLQDADVEATCGL
jgi:hypothetical protein